MSLLSDVLYRHPVVDRQTLCVTPPWAQWFAAFVVRAGGVNADLAAEVTGTLTLGSQGLVGDPTLTARYSLAGTQVLLALPQLVGTSDATNFELSGLPAGIRPTQSAQQLIVVRDNGVDGAGRVVLTAGSATLLLYPSAAQVAWTGTGAKGIFPCMVAYARL